MIGLIFEALFIGLLSLIIFVIINLIPVNLFIKLFALGFIKHYFGYISGIQNFYCNLYLSNRYDYESKLVNIIIESLFEGFFYLYIGLLLSKIIFLK